MQTLVSPRYPSALGQMKSLPRVQLFDADTPIESMTNLAKHCGDAELLVKRDDCNGLAFGGNKVRQLEFYFGAAVAEKADTILITGAVQSNFTRIAAAAARKLGMNCHIQQENRVASTSPLYHESGNALLSKIFGATLHSYPDGEDEYGADLQLDSIAAELKSAGNRPYIIHLGPDHPPLGALGYVVAALELLKQIDEQSLAIDEVFVGSGSGATHAGLLFGLRALGSDLRVTGVCVRRHEELQKARIHETCKRIADLLRVDSSVTENDIVIDDRFLAPGYGLQNDATIEAIKLAATKEGLLVDPVYTSKVLAATISHARNSNDRPTCLFMHTGGTPALFAYADSLQDVL